MCRNDSIQVRGSQLAIRGSLRPGRNRPESGKSQRISGPNVSEGWQALGVGPQRKSEKRLTEALLIQHAVYRNQRLDSAQHGNRLLAETTLVRPQHVGEAARHLHDGHPVSREIPGRPRCGHQR